MDVAWLATWLSFLRLMLRGNQVWKVKGGAFLHLLAGSICTFRGRLFFCLSEYSCVCPNGFAVHERPRSGRWAGPVQNALTHSIGCVGIHLLRLQCRSKKIIAHGCSQPVLKPGLAVIISAKTLWFHRAASSLFGKITFVPGR